MIRVGVLYGGMSSEREVSLLSGAAVAAALKGRYDVHLLHIDAAGKWEHVYPAGTTSSITPKDVAELVDIVFIALHGTHGEDGDIQALLDSLGICYTGSGATASALGMDKMRCMQMCEAVGIPVPHTVVLQKGEPSPTARITAALSFPCIIKPNASGSSVGVSLVHCAAEIDNALEKAWEEDTAVLAQEYITGKECSCAVLGNGSDELQALPIIEIDSQKHPFFDYVAKYTAGEAKEVCPAVLPNDVTLRVQEMAKKVHDILGCSGLTRSDFIIATDGTPYFLEINTAPGQTPTSLCPQEAVAAGMSFPVFLQQQVRLGIEKHHNVRKHFYEQ